jgi:hypothetical protein
MLLQTDVLEEAVFNPDTVLSIKDEIAGYDSSRQGDTEYHSLFGAEVNTGASGRHNTLPGKMNSQQKMLPQQYCLRWKYHHNNLQVMFSQLLERESFCDVTLACEGKTLRAHKVSVGRTYASLLSSEFKVPRWVVLQLYDRYTEFYKNNALNSILGSGYETLGHIDVQPDDRVPEKSVPKRTGRDADEYFLLDSHFH